MDRYHRVEKPRAESPINENEIRITTQGRMRNYITYATTLLQEAWVFSTKHIRILKMKQVIDSDKIAFHLLNQLEFILECDPLINEVGFIHPSQFATLDDDVVGSNEPVAHSIPRSVDEIVSTNLDVNDLQHDSSIFWSRDHKLAISTEALFPLYNAAKHAFMTALRQQKMIDSLCTKTNKPLSRKVTDDNTVSEIFRESEVMKHSKALLLLSCDNRTAWNSRKLISSKKQCLSLFMDELLLSALILSYAPKIESAWSHRRWVIKAIDGKCPEFEDVVERESELVEKIAEVYFQFRIDTIRY